MLSWAESFCVNVSTKPGQGRGELEAFLVAIKVSGVLP